MESDTIKKTNSIVRLETLKFNKSRKFFPKSLTVICCFGPNIFSTNICFLKW